ncbi:MAG: hypothetical protein ACRCXA_07765 [Peptostreptococcaceae bacterium]
MIIMGYQWSAIVRVKNNTDSMINEIKFTYDEDKKSTKIKKIKPNENKQTGVSAIYDVKNLIMSVEGVEKVYLIKDELPKGYGNTITIIVHSIDSNECYFDIVEE